MALSVYSNPTPYQKQMEISPRAFQKKCHFLHSIWRLLSCKVLNCQLPIFCCNLLHQTCWVSSFLFLSSICCRCLPDHITYLVADDNYVAKQIYRKIAWLEPILGRSYDLQPPTTKYGILWTSLSWLEKSKKTSSSRILGQLQILTYPKVLFTKKVEISPSLIQTIFVGFIKARYLIEINN